jgi:hypothetical protein
MDPQKRGTSGLCPFKAWERRRRPDDDGGQTCLTTYDVPDFVSLNPGPHGQAQT